MTTFLWALGTGLVCLFLGCRVGVLAERELQRERHLRDLVLRGLMTPDGWPISQHRDNETTRGDNETLH